MFGLPIGFAPLSWMYKVPLLVLVGTITEKQGPALASQVAGLEYARVLYALHTIRRDDLYETVAEGILASAMRQQAASGDAAGLLPEFWNVKDGAP